MLGQKLMLSNVHMQDNAQKVPANVGLKMRNALCFVMRRRIIHLVSISSNGNVVEI